MGSNGELRRGLLKLEVGRWQWETSLEAVAGGGGETDDKGQGRVASANKRSWRICTF